MTKKTPRRRYRKTWKFVATLVPVPLPPERKAAYDAVWLRAYDQIRGKVN